MFEYTVTFQNHQYPIVAKSRSSARYKFWKEHLEEFNFEFPNFDVSIRKNGEMKVSSFFTQDIDSFEYMKQYRDLGDWCQLGTRVEINGKNGYVVGSIGCNLAVLFNFPENPVTFNCHPHSQSKFFDLNGTVVKEYAGL